MLRFVGFQAQSGNITDERTGEVRPWSNRYIRAVTDQNLEPGHYGLGFINNKIKTVDICRSIGYSFKPEEVGTVAFENGVNEALKSFFDKEIEFTVGIVKGTAEVNGFRVIPNPITNHTK